jgi:hypothetical protein
MVRARYGRRGLSFSRGEIMKDRSHVLVVSVFSVAMAWVEAAVVLDLRVLVGRIQPYQPNPLPHFGGLSQAEIIREVATLVMLFAVGCLAGDRARMRFAFSAFAFGLWDVFYYLFLIPLSGWPRSLLDWDILFLLPVPWWGPVIAPIAIAFLMIAGGILAIWIGRRARPACWNAGFLLCGMLGAGMMLYAFTADGLAASSRGLEAVRQLLPAVFHWSIFLPGWLLMAAPVAAMAVQAARITRKGESET